MRLIGLANFGNWLLVFTTVCGMGISFVSLVVAATVNINHDVFSVWFTVDFPTRVVWLTASVLMIALSVFLFRLTFSINYKLVKAEDRAIERHGA